jgi:molybdenum cofactor cytidylyltransferase
MLSMADSNNRGNVFAIVLAAGTASRFGRTKQLEILEGRTLVGRAMGVARDACGIRTVLVAGHDSGPIIDAAGQLGYVVVNDNYKDGIGSSIATAVKAIAHVADAILLTLADQPLITAAHLESLIDAWSGDRDEIIATSFSNALGPPVLFPPNAFDTLSKLSGDVGARSLLGDEAFKVRTIEFADAAIDVDTPEDLTRL